MDLTNSFMIYGDLKEKSFWVWAKWLDRIFLASWYIQSTLWIIDAVSFILVNIAMRLFLVMIFFGYLFIELFTRNLLPTYGD